MKRLESFIVADDARRFDIIIRIACRALNAVTYGRNRRADRNIIFSISFIDDEVTDIEFRSIYICRIVENFTVALQTGVGFIGGLLVTRRI